MTDAITVYAPASIGNLSVGFDLLGLALQPLDDGLLGDFVTIEALPAGRDDWVLELSGAYADRLPQDPAHNIVLKSAHYFATQLTQPIQPARLRLQKSLPVCSGLGSSASSVVAALYALNEYYQRPFSPEQLLGLMGAMEAEISGSAHYDNIAPALLGGLIWCESGRQPPQALPMPEDWYIVVAYADIEVPTKKARTVLPPAYPREVLIKQCAAVGYFMHGLYSGDTALALNNIRDWVAEPYREELLPGFTAARKHLQKPGMAVGISGSGPTLFVLTDQYDEAERAQGWLQENYAESGFVRLCRADQEGARVIASEGADR